ncbi:hypothetical protein ElyMa_006145500 [Elysia marginata]|uniref:Uncharacterized protein n=1 Tax=Elysia marginata TaxID=1093978 RepID=A0AAV4GWE3_9GAST|nr:hypothetical protein ElyMa_006145500 [Elysia marginata]
MSVCLLFCLPFRRPDRNVDIKSVRDMTLIDYQNATIGRICAHPLSLVTKDDEDDDADYNDDKNQGKRDNDNDDDDNDDDGRK